ncbi:MAG: GNAT family N-acetyltransferase [Bacteroidetes bacterium]|nr:GNAT family N-acetyltransferase [Bacteroidota bacterium]
MEIIYTEEKNISKDELFSLYDDAGWSIYTKNLQKLSDAVGNSYLTITARVDGILAGLIRIISDGLTIVYVQDILVLKQFKRMKIGTELMKRVLERFIDVRQIVLTTDNSEEQIKFYESLGFKRNSELDINSFIKIQN